MVRFGNAEDLGYEEEFPICCIHIKPLLAKFADNLTHRDFLGALMNLGIERSTIGDIRVAEKEGYLFCQETIAEYICDNLDKIKHTNVKCEIVKEMKDIPKDEPEAKEVLVPSLRMDACLAKVYNLSRGDILEQFRAKKVYVNGRLCENNSRLVKEGETINLRGYGKFIYSGIKYETKKGKICIEVKQY
jgi:RNA-binding protein YlmH